jgi:hypothetical protein
MANFKFKIILKIVANRVALVLPEIIYLKYEKLNAGYPCYKLQYFLYYKEN